MIPVSRIAVSVLLCCAAVGTSLAQNPPSVPAPSAPVPAPSAPVQAPLSKKAALAAMPDDERKWLTEFVAPIILPDEEKLFLELTEPHQREIFKDEFWARRERQNLAFPMGPGYRQRYEELRQLADTTYDGWRNDAGRMVLRYGEPGSLDKVAGCDRMFRDLEIWTYTNLPGRGTMKQFFYRPAPMAPRKLWTVGTRDSDVFQPGSCRKNFEELANDCNPGMNANDTCSRFGSTCTAACDVYRAYSEIRARQGSAMGGMSEAAQLLSAPPVSTEGMEKVRDRFAGLATPKAKSIGVEGPSGTTETAPAGNAPPAAAEGSAPPAPGAASPAGSPAPAGASAAGAAPAGQAAGKFTGP
ncbi:MAG: GWxTD domain-containing protein, partial [Acidobacteriota bacterium]|nr:GWxTD domain-containing protein [Acidobacteriota bacterium]